MCAVLVFTIHSPTSPNLTLFPTPSATRLLAAQPIEIVQTPSRAGGIKGEGKTNTNWNNRNFPSIVTTSLHCWRQIAVVNHFLCCSVGVRWVYIMIAIAIVIARASCIPFQPKEGSAENNYHFIYAVHYKIPDILMISLQIHRNAVT